MEIKLKRWIYSTFGITFALIVILIVVWKLKFYDDVTAKIKTNTDALKTATTGAQDLGKNLQAAAIANDQGKLATRELEDLRHRFRSLKFDSSTEALKNATWVGYMNEYFADFGIEMRRQLVKAADDTNVVLSTSLKVLPPPQLPEAVIAPASGFLKPVDTGSMTVDIVGDKDHIERFFRRINRCEILMTVGNIKLSGASPAIKATFTITPYLVARGNDVKLAPSVAAPAAATTGGLTSPGGLTPAVGNTAG